MEKFQELAKSKFGVEAEVLYDVLRTSAGAEGYIFGAIGETLFKQYAEDKGYEVLRIKEKPEGGYDAKTDEARGDFYIRKKGNPNDEWYVVECKSVKSNAEKRLELTEKKKLAHFLAKHSFDRTKHLASIYSKGEKAYNKAQNEFKGDKTLYPPFRWNKLNPGAGIPDLSNLWKDKKELEAWINSFSEDKFTENAYWNLEAPVRLIQTHMPSTRIDALNIKSTGPLVSEFSILCLDLFLRTGKHEFVFVNSQDLNHQAKAPNHLQQNYTIDILVHKDNFAIHPLLKPWYNDLDECINATKPKARKLDKSQLDNRWLAFYTNVYYL